jgi:cobalt-zinc-cadmium efflux system outer membrane protein
MRTMLLRWSLLITSSLAVAGPPFPASAAPDALALSRLPADEALSGLLWNRNPDIVAARARVEQSQAEAVRAERWPNPILDASWNTIPIGETNPSNLDRPLANVPNYQVGLSTPIELGKRAPRKQATRYGQQAAALDAAEILRLVHLDLLSAIGRVATSEERIASLEEQVADAVRLTILAHERVTHGDVARLDEERAQLEEAKLRSLLAEEKHQLSGALLECGRLAGIRCEPFGSIELGHAFLDTHTNLPDPAVLRQALEKRPDLQSLSAQEAAAESALRLARARRLPDPTIRIGYTHDRFVISGNQKNSVGIGLAVPLPISERGQADMALALSARSTARTTRLLRMEQTRRDLTRLVDDFHALRVRQTTMRQEYLPLARSLVNRLTATVKAGGAPLPELLLARRSLNELLTDASDLDRSVFETALALRRLSGVQAITPPLIPTVQIP